VWFFDVILDIVPWLKGTPFFPVGFGCVRAARGHNIENWDHHNPSNVNVTIEPAYSRLWQ
jgi:hypothetical protein